MKAADADYDSSTESDFAASRHGQTKAEPPAGAGNQIGDCCLDPAQLGFHPFGSTDYLGAVIE
ncbi:hypothetical protein [Streptomyces sp. NPDC057429]|uniref:hypothetical protein n=1 Tax=Streptomyces sp. NPDC057429 TaxID=3346130 RepID=UPI0036BCE94B